jgi:predicted TIM-barrel fold metal-dependent hydrolase
MMDRRTVMAAAGALAATGAQAADPLADIPIVDTHFHIFDGSRPQGAPYMGSKQWETEHKGIALPADYKSLTKGLNIVAAIELEASAWVEDNLWVLERLQPDPLFVGTVGDLEPEKPDFAELFDRFRKNPLFLGIRCGNIWGRDVSKQVDDARFIDGLRRVADADLVMDSANPTNALLQAMVKINDKVPSLRIMIDHLPHLSPRPDTQKAYEALLHEIKSRANIFAKLSDIENRDSPARGLTAVKPRMDLLMETFGPDRVVFGTNWPESWGVATPAQIVSLARQYFATRTRDEAEKYFWKNSLKFYKWKKRAANQPSL